MFKFLSGCQLKAPFLFTLICCIALNGCVMKPKPLPSIVNSQIYFYGDGQRMCSATVIDESHAITAAHCLPLIRTPFGIMLMEQAVMTLEDGSVLEVDSFDVRLDRAILRGHFSDYEAAPVDFARGEVFKADQVWLCGYPGQSKELRCDFVKRVRNEGFQACFDVTLLPGQSGGGVFSPDGVLIGINQRVTEDGLSCVNSPTGMK